jgi:hypothetical protein
MKKFIHDILRDKGSEKFSITKVLALLFAIIMVIYICFVTYKGGEYDQFLIGQLLLAILTLTGFKNNFGINKFQSKDGNTLKLDSKAEPIIKDEGSF